MKKLNKYILVLLAMVVIIPACKDEDLVIVPEWESGVHAYTVVSEGSAINFVNGDPSVDLTFDILWNSIDGKNTVNKIEIFAYFSESYTDPDGNPAVASYGGADGISLLSFEGAAVPADKVTTSFSITQDDIYALFKDESFDYDKDGTATGVWTNPDKPNRNTTNRKFIPGDSFSIRWELTTADGRLFDSWSPSVCTEFPGANCSYDWSVICVSDLAGTYDVVSTFTSPGYFDSVNPDFQYGPGNDGSVANGVQTYKDVVVEKGTASATYIIPDITNGFEPIMWNNPPVKCIVTDACGALVLTEKLDGPSYSYAIKDGSKVNDDGSLTIIWENQYGENGVSTFTLQ